MSVDPAQDGLNLFAYCDGKPLNHIDPSGKYIYSVKKKHNKEILRDINYLGGGGFYFNKNNRLALRQGFKPKGRYSKYFLDRIKRILNDPKRNVHIDYSKLITHYANGGRTKRVFRHTFKYEADWKGTGGGRAWFADKRGEEMYVIVSPDLANKRYTMGMKGYYGLPSGKTLRAIVLGHELIGHAVPTLLIRKAGRKSLPRRVLKNAIKIENIIRRQMGLPSRPRAKDDFLHCGVVGVRGYNYDRGFEEWFSSYKK